jgi:hypothetical protein
MMKTRFSRTATRTPLYNLAIGGLLAAAVAGDSALSSKGYSKAVIRVARYASVTP